VHRKLSGVVEAAAAVPPATAAAVLLFLFFTKGPCQGLTFPICFIQLQINSFLYFVLLSFLY